MIECRAARQSGGGTGSKLWRTTTSHRHRTSRKVAVGRRGRPCLSLTSMRSADIAPEPLPNLKAIAVFPSDALCSVAYATEEILYVLIAAGTGALSGVMPISIGIIILLAIVAISYRQTIKAYPNGGGSYIV